MFLGLVVHLITHILYQRQNLVLLWSKLNLVDDSVQLLHACEVKLVPINIYQCGVSLSGAVKLLWLKPVLSQFLDLFRLDDGHTLHDHLCLHFGQKDVCVVLH